MTHDKETGVKASSRNAYAELLERAAAMTAQEKGQLLEETEGILLGYEALELGLEYAAHGRLEDARRWLTAAVRHQVPGAEEELRQLDEVPPAAGPARSASARSIIAQRGAVGLGGGKSWTSLRNAVPAPDPCATADALATQRVAQARQEAEDIVAAARREADKIIAAAREQAQQIITARPPEVRRANITAVSGPSAAALFRLPAASPGLYQVKWSRPTLPPLPSLVPPTLDVSAFSNFVARLRCGTSERPSTNILLMVAKRPDPPTTGPRMVQWLRQPVSTSQAGWWRTGSERLAPGACCLPLGDVDLLAALFGVGPADHEDARLDFLTFRHDLIAAHFGAEPAAITDCSLVTVAIAELGLDVGVVPALRASPPRHRDPAAVE